MNAYYSNPTSIKVDESGWYKLDSGREITKLPIVESDSLLFARLGHGPAGEWLRACRWSLPTTSEYMEMAEAAHHIEPYTLPDEELLAANKIKRTAVAVGTFRNRNMMSFDWCVRHDNEVWRRMTGWDGTKPIDNCGKHWADGGLIIGWWTSRARSYGVSNDTMIQTPSAFHRSEPTYVDYATTFHAVRESQDKEAA